MTMQQQRTGSVGGSILAASNDPPGGAQPGPKGPKGAPPAPVKTPKPVAPGGAAGASEPAPKKQAAETAPTVEAGPTVEVARAEDQDDKELEASLVGELGGGATEIVETPPIEPLAEHLDETPEQEPARLSPPPPEAKTFPVKVSPVLDRAIAVPPPKVSVRDEDDAPKIETRPPAADIDTAAAPEDPSIIPAPEWIHRGLKLRCDGFEGSTAVMAEVEQIHPGIVGFGDNSARVVVFIPALNRHWPVFVSAISPPRAVRPFATWVHRPGDYPAPGQDPSFDVMFREKVRGPGEAPPPPRKAFEPPRRARPGYAWAEVRKGPIDILGHTVDGQSKMRNWTEGTIGEFLEKGMTEGVAEGTFLRV
jgi:hypothetical protein